MILRLIGRRLPATDGTLSIKGLSAPVTIRRDAFGIPHVEAGSEADAAFALGFCHGQDRSFQLEMLLRAGRGTVAELVGEEGLPIDRLARRIGFHRAARASWEREEDATRTLVRAYVGGVNAARSRRPHELALLRRDPTPWEPEDVGAVLGVVALGLSANWDVELGRLRVLELDGEDALRAVDPAYPDWLAVVTAPGTPAGTALDRLDEDLLALAGHVGGGGSNNWALAGSRTASGRPQVANDPHLSPTLPCFWYLAHVRCPEWEVAGASVPGAPAVAVGHNEDVAWGVTNSGADVVDLFLEDEGAAIDVVEERIEVKGGDTVLERVEITPRGPIVSPAVGESQALSMRATWLDPSSLGGPLAGLGAKTWSELAAAWASWPGAPLNLVGADRAGTIGWQVVGDVPRREVGAGLLPRQAPGEGDGWAGRLAPDDLPGLADPEEGWVATANNKPRRDGDGPWLGADWMDGYRAQRIGEALEEREDWDLDMALALQRDVRSLVWRDVREFVLAAPREDPAVRRAVDLLHGWDGEVSADSAPATLFELFLAEMARRAVEAKAPRSAEWALGRGASPLTPHTWVALRHAGQIARLVREQPEGWFADGWDAEIAAALVAVIGRLEAEHGRNPERWGWGRLRTLTLRHPLGARRPFDRAFNLGPIPWGGDTNTVAQASNAPRDPLGDPVYLPTLRVAMDVGAWDDARAVLAGGQSGNPLSPHYADLFARWRDGETVPLPFSEEAVAAATRSTLRLEPAGGG